MLEFKVIDGGKVLVKPQMFYGSVVMDDRERMGAFFICLLWKSLSPVFKPFKRTKEKG